MLLTAGMQRLNAPMVGLSVLVLLTDQLMISRPTRYVPLQFFSSSFFFYQMLYIRFASHILYYFFLL
jgi:hypothetical protein